MQQKEILYGIIGLLGGTLLTILFTTNIVNSNNTGMMRMMGMSIGNQRSIMANSDAINAHFIEQMIPHHEDAITMAKLAQTKSQKQEVKELADSIIISQGKEISQMKDWYRDWFGKDLPVETVSSYKGMMGGNRIHMGMMGNDSDMTALEQSEDFDREFVEQMIPHHQMAVMMANMLKNGTNRSEMKKLADDIIEAQSKEIDMMRKWLQDWGV